MITRDLDTSLVGLSREEQLAMQKSPSRLSEMGPPPAPTSSPTESTLELQPPSAKLRTRNVSKTTKARSLSRESRSRSNRIGGQPSNTAGRANTGSTPSSSRSLQCQFDKEPEDASINVVINSTITSICKKIKE